MGGAVVLTVEDADAGTRLDVWLLAQLPEGNSRAGVQRWIKSGFVVREGELQANPARKVRGGEVYSVDVPAAEATELVGENIPLDIVFEDDDLLVINKPAGLTVHPAPGNYTGTLVQAVIFHCEGRLSGINGELRPGIVHRIDKDTSGLLVVAKNDAAHRGLARQFAKHSISRTYIAAIKGNLARHSGKVEASIGRHPIHRLRRAVIDGGKPAVTHYKVLERFGVGATLVECTLETGRTHQIRVHMAHLGHPLLGDPLYGQPGPLKGLGAVDLPRRQMLHAAVLGFNHPNGGKWMEFSSPLPADMQAVIGVLREKAAETR